MFFKETVSKTLKPKYFGHSLYDYLSKEWSDRQKELIQRRKRQIEKYNAQWIIK